MGMHATVAVLCLFCCAQLQGGVSTSTGTKDGMERWGYVNIRPKANLFWWYYRSPHRVSTPEKPWPTILWFQGGPGGSGVGRGNFQEVGPLDVDLNPRNSTWLQKADLIFIDSPVGVGYSYVEDSSALVKTDMQTAKDVAELLKALTVEIRTLQSSPLFLVGESYGGKVAAITGVLLARAIHSGTLKITLGGVVLGDSWISPDDFALSYPGLLHIMSRLDDNAVGKAIMMGITVKQQMQVWQFAVALKTWTDLLDLIDSKSGAVNQDNIMIDNTMGGATGFGLISNIMNGVIKDKLRIIPKDVVWQTASEVVYYALNNEFMKPAINEVDELLAYGVNVTVYNGQLDLICSTFGAEAWVKRLKWEGLHDFLSLPRSSLHYCHPYSQTNAFVRSYKNLHFYWILGAGHMVPQDQPCTALNMIGSVVQSPVG
ncbi:hypothetical protein ACP4OV_010277 [Aristida adscensionis]